jgi:hypothetical protein
MKGLKGQVSDSVGLIFTDRGSGIEQFAFFSWLLHSKL